LFLFFKKELLPSHLGLLPGVKVNDDWYQLVRPGGIAIGIIMHHAARDRYGLTRNTVPKLPAVPYPAAVP
jgi:hypothetical protein